MATRIGLSESYAIFGIFFSAKCENNHTGCIRWAADGQCFKTQPYMTKNCWKSCSFCGMLDLICNIALRPSILTVV